MRSRNGQVQAFVINSVDRVQAELETIQHVESVKSHGLGHGIITKKIAAIFLKSRLQALCEIPGLQGRNNKTNAGQQSWLSKRAT